MSEERVTLRRWTGDGMPPGPWSTERTPFQVEHDTAQVEAQDFLPVTVIERAIAVFEGRAHRAKRGFDGAAAGVPRGSYSGQELANRTAAEYLRTLLRGDEE